MTSKELNKTIDQLRNSPETANIQIAALYEIAYQIAKLNEHFEMVDGAVFGQQKPQYSITVPKNGICPVCGDLLANGKACWTVGGVLKYHIACGGMNAKKEKEK